MACDVVSVRLHLPQVRVLGVIEDTAARLVVSVESTLRRLRCPNCGFRCHRVGDRRGKRITDLEVSGRRMTLVWSRRRMVCDSCGSRFLEDRCAFEGGLTARLARAVVADGEGDDPSGRGAPARRGLAQDQRAAAGLGEHRRRAPPRRALPGAAGR